MKRAISNDLNKVTENAEIQTNGIKYPVNECKEMEQETIPYLACADDIVLMAESPKALQQMVTSVNKSMRDWCLHYDDCSFIDSLSVKVITH